MGLYLALVARNGKKNFSYTMADIISYNATDKKHCESDTHYGENQIQPIGSCRGETMCENIFYGVDNPL